MDRRRTRLRLVSDGALRSLMPVLAWCLVVLIVAVTLSPIAMRPTSGAPVSLERFGAFLALGLIFTTAYSGRVLLALVWLVGLATILEILQNLVPGRHGRVEDLAVKVAAILVGFALFKLVTLIRTAFDSKSGR